MGFVGCSIATVLVQFVMFILSFYYLMKNASEEFDIMLTELSHLIKQSSIIGQYFIKFCEIICSGFIKFKHKVSTLRTSGDEKKIDDEDEQLILLPRIKSGSKIRHENFHSLEIEPSLPSNDLREIAKEIQLIKLETKDLLKYLFHGLIRYLLLKNYCHYLF